MACGFALAIGYQMNRNPTYRHRHSAPAHAGSLAAAMFGPPTTQVSYPGGVPAAAPLPRASYPAPPPPPPAPAYEVPEHLGIGGSGAPQRRFAFGVPETVSGPVTDPWYEGGTSFMGTFEAAGQTHVPATNQWEETDSLGAVGQSWQHHKTKARNARSKANTIQAQAYHQHMREKYITALQNRQQAAFQQLARPTRAASQPRPSLPPQTVMTAPMQGPGPGPTIQAPTMPAVSAYQMPAVSAYQAPAVPASAVSGRGLPMPLPPRKLTRQVAHLYVPPVALPRVHQPSSVPSTLPTRQVVPTEPPMVPSQVPMPPTKTVRFAKDPEILNAKPAEQPVVTVAHADPAIHAPKQQPKPRRPEPPKMQPLQGGGLDRPIDAYHSEFCPDADGGRPKPYVIKTESDVLNEVARFDEMGDFEVVNGEIVVPEDEDEVEDPETTDELEGGIQIGPVRLTSGTLHSDTQLFLQDAKAYVNTMFQRGRDAGLTGADLKKFAEAGVRVMIDLTSENTEEEEDAETEDEEDAEEKDIEDAEDEDEEEEEEDGDVAAAAGSIPPVSVPDAVEATAEPEPAPAVPDEIPDEGEDVRVFHPDGTMQRLSEEQAQAQAKTTGSDELNPTDVSSWTYDKLHSLNRKALTGLCSQHSLELGPKYVNKEGLIAKLLELQ